MNIYIMSRGRAGKVTTYKWIPPAWRKYCQIVVPQSEVADYMAAYGPIPVMGAPDYVTNYSQKVQWLINDEAHGGPDKNEKVLIMDDDLVFSSRSDPLRPNSLISIKDPLFLDEMYHRIARLLNDFALVGVHPRQMGQNASRPFVKNGRIICIQAVNRSKIGHVKVDQFPILADVVLNCTLLARGQENALLTTYFQDHGPCQAPGGCSIYRTAEMQRDAVSYLARRFPGYVKSVERRAKVANWLGGDSRIDYTCQWKRLLEAGVAFKEGRGLSPDIEVIGSGHPPQL